LQQAATITGYRLDTVEPFCLTEKLILKHTL